MDADFAGKTVAKYHAEFLKLLDDHVPHGNAAFQTLYAKFSTELTDEFGKYAADAVAEVGESAISQTIEMTAWAYPNLIIPKS